MKLSWYLQNFKEDGIGLRDGEEHVWVPGKAIKYLDEFIVWDEEKEYWKNLVPLDDIISAVNQKLKGKGPFLIYV